MAGALSPQDLECPDPDGCPVVRTLPRLRPVRLREGTALYRVYDATWGYDEHNPGYGDARFSPVDDPISGDRLPSMYLAATPTAALLETVFHDVHHDSARTIYERDLRGKLLAHLRVPAVAALGDLRDPELDRLGLTRDQVVSSPAEHYPCTRRLAIVALAQPRGNRVLQGLIWHSRQAELAGEAPVEVVALFGEPRYPSGRGSWHLFGPGASSLYEGPGRLLVEEIAEALGAVIELEEL
jgi:RES domain